MALKIIRSNDMMKKAGLFTGFSKLGYCFGGPHNKVYSILGSMLGPPILRNYLLVFGTVYGFLANWGGYKPYMPCSFHFLFHYPHIPYVTPIGTILGVTISTNSELLHPKVLFLVGVAS